MLEYGLATKDDIEELIQLRIAYMIDDFGSVSEVEKDGMKKQLPSYFERKLGTEFIAFVARDNDRIVSVAYLHIIEMPANSVLLNGLYGDVLSVYTVPECTFRPPRHHLPKVLEAVNNYTISPMTANRKVMYDFSIIKLRRIC
ncbi:MAG: hypothetical protein K6F55_02630 [Eubacterium sp.]|nr:hypothetical protein [Eubacterium sp.]